MEIKNEVSMPDYDAEVNEILASIQRIVNLREGFLTSCHAEIEKKIEKLRVLEKVQRERREQP